MATKYYPKSFKSSSWTTTTYYQNGVNCPKEVYTPDASTSISWNDSVTGERNPFWRTAIAQGTSATTSFSGFKQKARGGSGFAKVVISPDIYQHCGGQKSTVRTGNIIGIPTTHLSVTADGTAPLKRCKQSIVSQASRDIQPFMGGVFLGELRKTLHMIRSPAASMRRRMIDYLKVVKKPPRNLSPSRRRKWIANTYLEHAYGWTPLFYDVQGGLDAFHKLASDSAFEIKTFKAYSGKVQGSATQVGGDVLSSGLITLRWDRTTVLTLTGKMKAGVKIQTAADMKSAPQTFGFHNRNWLPTAWELLPYSFLMDYFTNVGDVINAFSLIQPNLAWINYSERNKKVTTFTGVQITANVAASRVLEKRCNAPKSYLETVTFARSAPTSIIPILGFELPEFASKQALNTAFLALAKVQR